MEKKKFIIAISRQYGAGGRAVGKALAEELGVHFYDEEILKITSETSAIGEQYFRLADEKAGNNLLYKIFDSIRPEIKEPKVGDRMTSPDNLFRFQAKIIKEIAERESCIIAGRAANYVLKEAGIDDVISIYVYADMKRKIERIMDLESTDAVTAEKHVRKIDRERTEFYKYYTGLDWNDMQNYDLCINSSDIEYPQIARIIKDYMHTRGYDI
ncbi:MAG TPA: cytidylate kinase-like family protein [Candidatus Avilachnospira avistercoris]|nr:cytidylate kinase-like family protein [Candidatus Avilachnospira avistercoris]